MKTNNIGILLLITLFSFNLIAAELDQYSLDQPAIIKNDSKICHGALYSGYYDSFKDKMGNASNDYTSYSTMTECLDAGNRLDKRYEKRFQSYLTLKAQNEVKKSVDKLKGVAADTSSTAQEISDATIEVERQVSELKEANIKEVEAQQEAKQEDEFYGFSFAPGIAALFYEDTLISDLRIETKDIPATDSDTLPTQEHTIFIDKELERNIAIMLETHYLFEGSERIYDKPWGWGPFLATNVYKKSGDPLTMFALGGMISFKHSNSESGFSIGLGYFIDSDFKVLRDGYEDGGAIDFTDTTKAVKTTDTSGWMLMLSSKF